jgi:hypothetical protein
MWAQASATRGQSDVDPFTGIALFRYKPPDSLVAGRPKQDGNSRNAALERMDFSACVTIKEL